MDKMREDILARGENPADFPVLNDKPELYRDLLWIWEGFMVLSTMREYGMSSPQPIAIGAVKDYCDLYYIRDLNDREEFLHHIVTMDTVWQADWRVKNPSKNKPGRGAPQSGNFQS